MPIVLLLQGLPVIDEIVLTNITGIVQKIVVITDFVCKNIHIYNLVYG